MPRTNLYKPTEMQDEGDKMTYRKVGVKNVNYKASPEFVKEVKIETDRYLERDMGGVKRVLRSQYRPSVAHLLAWSPQPQGVGEETMIISLV